METPLYLATFWCDGKLPFDDYELYWHLIGDKINFHEKRKNKLLGYSYSKIMGKFWSVSTGYSVEDKPFTYMWSSVISRSLFD